MAFVGTVAFMVVPAFIAGITAAAIFNYIQLRKWRREQKPVQAQKKGWYHTWHRS